MDYVIMTDSNSEFPLHIAKERKLKYVPMPYMIDDQEFFYDLGEKTDFKAFFNKMKAGAVPKTSTYSADFYLDFFRPTLEEGKDILFVAFSSTLSAAFSYLMQAVEQLREEFPQRTLRVVDTLSISMGSGLLSYYAFQLYDQGKSLEEVAAWIEQNRLRVNHLFMVDDLVYLKRGGRISATSALVGKMLDVRPVLTVNNEGRIVVAEKVKGRKKGIRYLAERAAGAADTQDQMLVILHADCEQEALVLKENILARAPYPSVYINNVGPVIGTHCGPGTLAVIYLDDKRLL